MINHLYFKRDLNISLFAQFQISLEESVLTSLRNKEIVLFFNEEFQAVYGLLSKNINQAYVKVISDPIDISEHRTYLSTIEETIIANRIENLTPILIVEDIFDYISIALTSNTLRLFRGQANAEWGLLPSVFRSDYNSERDIYSELTQANHKEFTNKDFIENTCNMQHYGIPTRLLDWTGNSLHSLYFACVSKENENNNGAVFVVKIDEIVDIDTQDSEDIALFLEYKFLKSPTKRDEVSKFLKKVILTDSRFKFFRTKYFNERIRNQKGLFSIYFEITEEDVTEIKELFLEELNKELERKDFKEYRILPRLINEYIRPARIPYDNIEELVGSVLEKLDYGSDKQLIKRVLEDHLSSLNQLIEKSHNMNEILSKQEHLKIIIRKEIKRTIISQLDDMGINSSTVYPDIEGLSRYLNEKYITASPKV